MLDWLLAIFASIGLIAGAAFLYNGMVRQWMKRHLAGTVRHPETGIMKGAEPITLTNGSSKKAALLLHGFIGSPTDYGRLPRLLHERGYDVHAPLLPGHGTDPRDFSKTTAGELESFVVQKYRALKQAYDEVVLIGFSMGGALGVLTASQEAVDKLVLVAPYFRISHRWFYVFPAEFYQRAFQSLVPYTHRPIAFKQINNRAAIPHMVDYDFVSLKGAEAAIELGNRAGGRVKDLRQPTLILHGRHDRATDYRASEKAARDLMGRVPCRLVTLENSNHVLLWDNDAETVEKEILEFIAQPREVFTNGGRKS